MITFSLSPFSIDPNLISFIGTFLCRRIPISMIISIPSGKSNTSSILPGKRFIASFFSSGIMIEFNSEGGLSTLSLIFPSTSSVFISIPLRYRTFIDDIRDEQQKPDHSINIWTN
jgi:ascorbate-specific PTS system EIIC-type component UlaA